MKSVAGRVMAICLVVLALFVPAGCGGGAGGSGRDLAELVPADALAYAEFTIDTDSEPADRLFEIIGRFSDEDLRAELESAIDENTDGLSFDDLDAAFCDRAAAYAGDFAIADQLIPSAAVFAEVADQGKAEELIELIGSKLPEAQETEVDGITYMSAGPLAYGIVDDLFILGTTAGLTEVAQNADGAEGERLADRAEFTQTERIGREDTLAYGYFDFAALFDLAERAIDSGLADGLSGEGLSPGGSTRQLWSDLLDYYKQGFGLSEIDARPAAFAIDARDDRISFVALTGSNEDRPELSSPTLSASVPEDAWLAVSADDYFKGFEEELRSPILTQSLSFSKERIERVYRKGLGIDLAALGALEDLMIAARGTTVDELSVRAVLGAPKPQGLRAALNGFAKSAILQRLGDVTPLDLPDPAIGYSIESAALPKPLLVGLGKTRLVITYGDDGFEDLLSADGGPTTTGPLADAGPLFGEGGVASGAIDLDAVVALVADAGDATDEDLAKAEPVDLIAVGGRDEGDVRISQFIFTVD